MHRLLAAAAALATGGALAATLILSSHAAPAGRAVLVAVHDLPGGVAVPADAVRVARIGLDGGASANAVPAGGLGTGMRSTHALAAGQLIQRTDVEPASSGDMRLVLLPIKDAPGVLPGDRVDLMSVVVAGERTSVTPFLLGVEVRSAGQAGVVVAVTARQAPAVVYAATATRLVLVAGAGQRHPEEPAIGSLDQALAQVRS